MSEVAKVRDALERLVPCFSDHEHDEVCARYTRLETAFVAHGLKVCEDHESKELQAGKQAIPPRERVRIGWTKHTAMWLLETILRDAGLLEG